MLWSFIAVCLSAWLSVDASYRGPTLERLGFKPLTLLLLLLLAWQAPMFEPISSSGVAGLCASLLGRCANPGCHAQRPRTPSARFPLAPAVHHLFRQSDDALFLCGLCRLVLLVLGALLLAIIWTRLEENNCWPICACLSGMTLVVRCWPGKCALVVLPSDRSGALCVCLRFVAVYQ